MAWRVGLVKIQILETGCSNTRGFTLIELLVVMLVIGIASSLIFLNFNTVTSISKNQSSFTDSFNFLSEESVLTGNVIGWHANNHGEYAYSFNHKKSVSNSIYNPHSLSWKDLSNYRKTFQSFDGSIVDLDNFNEDRPLILFYPSGENSGGIINIDMDSYEQKITINSNGKVLSEVIKY